MSGTFDPKAASDLMEGDEDLVLHLIDAYLESYPGTLSVVREAVRGRDVARLRLAAHRLRGAASIFGARAAIEALFRLEGAAPETAYPEVAWELEQLADALRDHRHGRSAT